MKLARILTPVVALLAVAACTASTEATAPKDVFYVTPAVAATMSPDRVSLQDGTVSGTLKADAQPFLRGESSFTPASGDDLAELKMQPDVICWACSDDGTICIRVCCPWEKGCVLTSK
jgi:hypothetical protein